MHGKEFVNDMIYTYFMLVTMILVIMAVLGTYFMPETSFGYEAFGSPLIYAAYGTLPNIIMYAKKELTIKQYLVRKAIQLVVIEIIIIRTAIPKEMIAAGKIDVAVWLAISIFVIFILTHLIEWFQNWAEARMMTEELQKFKQNNQ